MDTNTHTAQQVHLNNPLVTIIIIGGNSCSHLPTGGLPANTIGEIPSETRWALPVFSSAPTPSTGLELLAAAAQATTPPGH